MKYLFLLIPFVLLFSCASSGDKEELSSLKDEVMAIHDEVMPKMGELRRARKDLLLQADSLMESNPDRAAMLTTVADEIADANESMMQWMRAYEPEFEGTDEEIKQYLEDQKKAIQEVKEQMNGSLAKGQEILEN
ncbi:hypothetical protein [Ekhidna sp.]|uniref:hypothetical protein n=1 Tax=Ekhidna sp. TaxID=2608089 RepID=UPI003CCC281E